MLNTENKRLPSFSKHVLPSGVHNFFSLGQSSVFPEICTETGCVANIWVILKRSAFYMIIENLQHCQMALLSWVGLSQDMKTYINWHLQESV